MMKHMKQNSKLVLLIGIFLICVSPGHGKFAREDTRQVPIARLIKNLESQRADAVGSMERALVDFRIGRLQSMAYARKTEEGPTSSAALPGRASEVPEFGHTPDHVQFRVEPASNAAKQASARAHLKLAITHLQAAVKSDSSLLSARLGLAWCLDQSGDKTGALNLYRQVFKDAFYQEKESKGGMYSWSITVETAEYLRKLLDPVKDKKELDSINAAVSEINKLPRYITPILLPLDANTELSSLLINKKVAFDLDGFGTKTYSQWTSPLAAWLVIDQDKSGRIDSGLKLVGQSSFWVFWRNGYEVLNSLDDDRDGLVMGRELDGLAVWHDINLNGLSEKGEVEPLAHWSIVALGTASRKHKTGIQFSKKGIRYSNGRWVPSYDVILHAVPSPAHVAPKKGDPKNLVLPTRSGASVLPGF